MKSNKFKTMILRFFNSLVKATKRFPYAIALAAFAAVVMIVYTHTENSLTQIQIEWFQRTAMVLFLGIPLALSLKMLFELSNIKNALIAVGIRLLGLGMLVLYLFFGLPEFKSTYIIRYAAFLLFFWGMFLVVPFLKGREQIEVHTFKVGWRLLVTAFYCGIIYGGLSGILFSLKELLDVPIVSEHYQDLLFIIAGVILPAFFFVGIPGRDDKMPDSHTKFFRILLIYVVMPILTAYTVVLYLYFLRMIIEQSLPKNIIGNLVLWYSLAGILILFLSRTETNKSKWAKIFDRWFPRLLFIPLGMMFTAIFIRVNQYGITEPRYFTIIGGAWAFSMAVYILFTKPEKRRNVIIPLTAALLALLTVIGPWSAFSVSKHSQNNRLKALLNQQSEAIQEESVASIDLSAQNQISSIVLYFDRNHDLDDIKHLDKNSSLEEIEKELGFELNEWSPESYDYVFYNLRADDYVFALDDYDYLFFARENKAVIDSRAGKITIENLYEHDSNAEHEIVISLDNQEVFRKDISYYGEELYSKYQDRDELFAEEMSFVHDLGDMKIKIIFFHLELDMDIGGGEETKRGVWADYIVLIDEKS